MSEERIRRAANSKFKSVTEAFEDNPEMTVRSIDLLKSVTQKKIEVSRLGEEIDEATAELAAICEAYSLDGLRYGLNCFEYYGWKTRKTLSKERLLELGVPAETIEAAYAESKPFLSTKVNPFDAL